MIRGRGETRNGRRGFTLIELLVVMMILVIAFFAMRPSFVGVLRGAEKRGALRKIAGLLVTARAEAIAKGKLVRVVCTPAEGVLWVEMQVDPAVDLHEFELVSVLGRPEVRLPEHLRLDEVLVGGQPAHPRGDAAIYFYPDGRTDGARLVVASDRGEETVVHVAPATGRVTIRA
jgi:prepilin-type N-terminal cleavage/methylation domain-containing protein